MDALENLRHLPGRPVVLSWLVVIASVAIGYLPMLPPDPVPASASPVVFSADRAMDHVRVIARQPHAMGTPAIAEVRGYIVGELEQLGLEVNQQIARAPDFFGGEGTVDIVNLVATVPGVDSTGSVALVAHYDTVPSTPGANDNSVAVSALIETGRALLAGPALRNDVVLLFTDAEEPNPRFGANAFASSNTLLDDIHFVLNLEASGGSGASIIAEINGCEICVLRELAAADGRLAAFSFVTEITGLMGELGTDFDVFRSEGIAGVHLAYLHGSPIYHTPADDIDSVSLGSLQHHGDQALGVARGFGARSFEDSASLDDLVFFTVVSLVVSYATSLAVPLAVLLVGLFALWIRRNGHGTTASSLRTAGRLVAAGVVAVVVGFALWVAVTVASSTPGVAESYVYLIVLLAGGSAVARYLVSGVRQLHRRGGILAVWSVMAAATSVVASGFSYLFVWPALIAVVALLFEEPTTEAGQIARLAVVTTPVMVLMVPAIDVFFQFAQPRPGNPGSEMLVAIVLPMMFGLLAVGMVCCFWPATQRRGDVPVRQA